MRQKKARILTKAALVLGAVWAINGCTSVPKDNAFDPPLSANFAVDKQNIMLIMPDIEEREQYQLLIARLTQLLNSATATSEQRAQIFYQLGVLYDRLGLDVTARSMFMSSLIEVPDFSNAYNFLGVYFTNDERFSEAYDAYDSALEINKEEVYAYYNRGIALYYGGRAKLGIDDLLKFYELDKNDPFRIAWLYILERTVYGKEYANEHAAARQKEIEKEVPWGLEILDFMQGKISADEVIQAVKDTKAERVEQARRLCEAYFYLGQIAKFEHKDKLAFDYFNLCIATNVTGYLEYRYAQLEILRYLRAEQVFKVESKGNELLKERMQFFKQQSVEADKFFKSIESTLKEESSSSESSLAPSSSSDDSSSDAQSKKSEAR